jgi:hypothetical protein
MIDGISDMDVVLGRGDFMGYCRSVFLQALGIPLRPRILSDVGVEVGAIAAAVKPVARKAIIPTGSRTICGNGDVIPFRSWWP